MTRTEPTYFVKYPCLQVRTWGLLAYDRVEWLTGRKKKDSPAIRKFNHSSQNITTDVQQAYTGQLTPYAKKKLKRAIQLMVASAVEKEAPNFKKGTTFKFKVNFITLTLPAPQREITDKQLKKEVLDNYIKRLKRKFKLNSYVWRAERQKNGNLHFHMITDTWIHYEKLRNDWNACLQKFHFIDEFEGKHKHRNPNSTDVHAVWKVKNLTQYFIKYMSKTNPEGDKIEGKIWDCSKNLKTKQNCEMILEGEAAELWQHVTKNEDIELKSDANYTLAFLTPYQFNKYITGTIRTMWESYLATIRGSTLPPATQPAPA